MGLLRKHWIDVVVIGVLQAFVGWAAVATMSLIVENQTVRDIGVVLLWAIVLVVGGVVLNKRLVPVDAAPYTAPQDEPLSGDSVWSESHNGYVGLPGQMFAIPGLVDKYPNLGVITPPSIIEELGKYVNEFYQDRRHSQPFEPSERSLHDNETMRRYRDEFETPVAIAKDYLETRGVNLDTQVSNVRDIRALARRLDEASEWEDWPR